MIYTLSLNRLFSWRIGRDARGTKILLQNFRIAEDDFAAVQDGVLAALKIARP